MNRNLAGFLIGAGIGILLFGKSDVCREKITDVYDLQKPNLNSEIQPAIYFPPKDEEILFLIRRTEEVFY